MAVLVLAVLLLAMTGHSFGATYCVCKDNVGEQYLQTAIDYACGAGADCNPIKQNGPCYQPNSVKAHCSYAVNSYFQKKSQSGATCNFNGAATVTSSDPSTPGCIYPASASAAGTSTTGNTPTNTSPFGNTPSSTTTNTSPFGNTPSSTGAFGGIGTGMGPTGAGDSTDFSDGGLRLLRTGLLSFFTSLLIPTYILLW